MARLVKPRPGLAEDPLDGVGTEYIDPFLSYLFYKKVVEKDSGGVDDGNKG